MLIVIQILFALLNIGVAEYRHEVVSSRIHFRGNFNLFLYLLLAGIAAYCYSSVLLFVCLFLIRLVVFDVAFNVLRGMPVFHVNRASNSLIDTIHHKVFGNKSELYIPLYLLLLLTLNILFL